MPPKSRAGQLLATRRANGLCRTCGDPVTPDATGYRKAQCDKCLADRSAQRAERRAAGLCVKCQRPALVVKDEQTNTVVATLPHCVACYKPKR